MNSRRPLQRWPPRESEALFRSGSGEGLLTTVAGDGLPRTHPVNVGIVEGRLLTFVQGASAKARDLATDGRYSLHAHLDPDRPDEFLLRGRGTVITDAAIRAKAVASWPFNPADSYPLVELDIEHALFGDRSYLPRHTLAAQLVHLLATERGAAEPCRTRFPGSRAR